MGDQEIVALEKDGMSLTCGPAAAEELRKIGWSDSKTSKKS